MSTLTAGQWDQLHHYVDKSASGSFRIAFQISLVVMALAGLAPGTISVGTVFHSLITYHLAIGNMSLTSDHVGNNQVVCDRAKLITRMERVESTQFGYSNAENWIVGWPPKGLPTSGSGPIEYPTDVLKYGYNCQWEMPTWDGHLYGAGGVSWTLSNFGTSTAPSKYM